MATGRKKDSIWNHFVQREVPGKTGFRAECKKCKKEIVGLVARMKIHFDSCASGGAVDYQDGDDPSQLEKEAEVTIEIEPRKRPSSDVFTNANSNKKHATTPSLNNYFVKTSKNEKEIFDVQIARFFYATNAPFSSVDHKEFKQLISNLRPGYKPPNCHDLAGSLLDKVHNSVMETYEKDLKGHTVCAALDGWSNIHNEPNSRSYNIQQRPNLSNGCNRYIRPPSRV